MSYKCVSCGHIFEDGEQASWEEAHGDFLSMARAEKVSGCPLCKGGYEETETCGICGSEHLADELTGGVCDECVEKYQKDIDMCLKIGANDTDEVELNCFLASCFEKDEIEKILFEILKEKEKYMKEFVQASCERFVDADRSWFAEMLVEEVNKSENGKK